MKRLVINADDFGLHPCINEAILRGHLVGCITSASLMATGAAFEDAVHIARETPSLGVGVHLTLVAEKPLLGAGQVKSLVDREGRFPQDHIAFIRAYLTGRIEMDEIRRELTAQIERVLSAGVSVTHLDSHQHLHILPKIMDLCVALADEYKIRAIRIPAEPYGFTGGYKADLKRIVGKCGLTYLAERAREKAMRHGLASPGHFFGMLAGGHLAKRFLAAIILSLPEGSSEIMVHPGTKSEILQETFGWAYAWEEEFAAVTDWHTLQLIRDCRVKLSSFGELLHE